MRHLVIKVTSMMVMLVGMFCLNSFSSFCAFADDTTIIEGKVYSFYGVEDITYPPPSDRVGESTNEDNTYGSLIVSGGLSHDRPRNGIESFSVQGDSASFSYVINKHTPEWTLWETKDTKLGKTKLNSKMNKGVILVQSSENGMSWTTDIELTDAFSESQNKTGDFYTVDSLQLAYGCYYRVIVGYYGEQSYVDDNGVIISITRDNIEVYEFFLHNATLGEKLGIVSEALVQKYYYDAIYAQEAGDIDRAIELYKLAGNYNDAIDRLLQCYDAKRIKYAYINVEPVNAGYKVGYQKRDSITKNNLQYGWTLGRFIIAGYTEEENGVYIKTLGDDITLLFDIYQDINSLKGNPKMFIAEDNEAWDDPFGYIEKGASFGRGALLVQFEDHEHHNKTLVPPYTNFLAANYTGVANTRVKINEEGTYEVALDYLIRTSGFGGKTEGYRTSFTFEVKNGDGIAFLRDVTTRWELQDYSITENGFFVDFAGSSSVQVHVTRQEISANGNALDTREDRPASSDKHFTKHGYYAIEMTNTETKKTVTKHIFVGSQSELLEFIRINPNLGAFDYLGS